MTTTDASLSQDQQHLDLLGVFHYVVAGLAAVFSLLPLIHLAFGIAMVTGHMGGMQAHPGGPDPAWFGWFFIAIALLLIVSGLTFSLLFAYAGTCLRRRRRHTFCIVMAAIGCAFMPFGTVLGIFTLIVLTKPSVRSLFAQA